MKLKQAWEATKGFFSDTAGDVFDSTAEIKNDFISNAKEIAIDTGKFLGNVVETSVEFFKGEGDIWKDPYDKNIEEFKFDDDFIKESKTNYTAQDMISGIGGQVLEPIGKFILGDKIEKNLRGDLSFKDFTAELQKKQAFLESLNAKQQLAIDDNKFLELNTFDMRVRDLYITVHGALGNEEEIQRFKAKEFSKLDGVTQAKYIRLSKDYTKILNASVKEQELATKAISTYLDTNVIGGSQLYNDINTEADKKAKENAYLKFQTKNYIAASAIIRESINTKISGMTNASDYVGLERLIDELIQKESANREYLLNILGNEKLPNYKQLASQWKTIMEIERKLGLNMVESIAQKRNHPDYKSLTETEFRDRIETEEYYKLSKEEKDLFRLGENFKTTMAMDIDRLSLKDKAWYNPTKALNYFSLTGAGAAKIYDEILDYENEVPHYVKQQMRGLVYSEEGILSKGRSMLLYNPDVILSIASIAKLTNISANKINGIASVLGNIAGKRVPVSIKIGFDKISVLGGKKLTNVGKNLVMSQVYGASADSVLDISLASAKSTELDTFNQLTNTLFDGIFFIGGASIKGGVKGTGRTMNRIMYEFLNESETAAVDGLISIIKKNSGETIGKGEANKLMTSYISLYNTFTDRKGYVKVFREKGGLHKFITENIAQMEKHDIDALLTGQGIGLVQKKLGLDPRFTIKDLTNTFLNTIDPALTNTPNTKEIRKDILNSVIDKLGKQFEVGYGGSVGREGVISKKFKKDQGYLRDLESIKRTLIDLKGSKTLDDFLHTFKELEKQGDELKINYSNQNKIHTFTLTNTAGYDYIISVNSLKELEGKNFSDLLRDGSIKLLKGDIKGLDEGVYIVKQSKQGQVEKSFTNFLSQQDDFIDDWITSNGDLITVREVKIQLNNLLFGKSITKTDWIKGTIEEQEELLTSFAILLNDVIGTYLGGGIMSSAPLYINKSIKVNDTTGFASKEQIMDMMKAENTYFNISFGSFIGKNDTKEAAGQAIYMGFGAKIFSNEHISTILEGTKGTTHFQSTLNVLKNKIITLGFKEGVFTIEKGIKQAAATIAYGDIDGLFKQGKVDRMAIKQMVDQNLETKNNVEITDFIFNVTKNATEADAMILKPIIYNLIYQYSTNRDIINKALIGLGKNTKFDEVFSGILLSKDIRDYITERIVDKSFKEKTIDVRLKAVVDDQWTLYKDKIINKLESLELDKLDIEDVVKNSSGAFERDQALKEIDKAIFSLKEAMRFQGTSKSLMYKKLYSFNNDFLTTKLNNFRDNLVVNGRLGDKAKTYKDNLDTYKSIIERAKKLSDPEKEMLSGVVQKIADGVMTKSQLERILEESAESTKDFIEDLISIKNNMGDRPHVIKDLGTLDNYFQTQINNSDTLEFLLEHNPLVSKMAGFISGSTYKSKGTEDLMMKAFGDIEGSDITSGYAFYNTNIVFKSFINSLHIKNGIDEKEIPKIVKENKARIGRFIRGIFKDEIYTVNGHNVKDDLIEEMLRSDKLYNQLKDIRYRIETSGDKWINFEKGHYSFHNDIGEKIDVYPTHKTKKTFIVNDIMQFKLMKEAGMDIVRLHGLDASNISKLSTDKQLFHSQDITLKSGETIALKEMGGPADSLKHFAKVFNLEAQDATKILPLFKGYEKYAFVGGIGDKDGLLHLYKLPDEITKGLKLTDKQLKKFTIEYYKYAYGYAQSYIKKDSKYNNIKTFTRSLGKYTDIKSFRKELSRTYNMISETDMTKREPSNVSYKNTFDGLKKTVSAFVEKPKTEIPPELEIFNPFVTKKSSRNIFDRDKGLTIDEILLWKDSKFKTIVLKKYKYLNDDIEELNIYLDFTYLNDLKDGTAYATNALGIIRAQINGIDESKFTEGEYRQFKDHLFGEIDTGKGKTVRLFGKALFNLAEIEVDNLVLDSAVILLSSTVKLGKDLIDWNNIVKVKVNGVEREMVKLPDIDTSFFKDASSDSFKSKDSISVSDSIKNSLSPAAIAKMNDVQYAEIELLFAQLQKDLTSFDNVSSFSAIDNLLNKIPYDFGKGYGTNSVVQSKLLAFTTKMNEIISKPTSGGKSMFIKESSTLIKENEVIMHAESKVVKQIREEVSLGMYNKAYKDLRHKETVIVNKNLYTVGYRYPVPNSYNIGTYRIRLHREFEEYKSYKGDQYANLGKEQVVPHPESTYIKLQGDNDGDHLFFISSNSTFGKILSMDTLDKMYLPDGEVSELIDNYWEELSKGYDNQFIIVKQVAIQKSNKPRTLLETRLANTEAHLMINIVSASIRTLKATMTKSTPAQLLIFAKVSSQLLQDTLDFGKTGKLNFDPEWFKALIEASGKIDTKELRNLVKAQSIAYSKLNLDAVNIGKIYRQINPKNWTGKVSDKYLGLITGGKKALVERIYNNKELMQLIENANNIYSLPYFVKHLFPEAASWKSLQLKLKTSKYIGDKDFLVKSMVKSLVEKEKSTKFKEALKHVNDFMTSDKEKKGDLANKIFLKKDSIFFQLPRQERLKLAAYGLLHGEHKLYNFLTNSEMILFLKDGDKNFDQILKKNDLVMNKTVTEEEAKLYIEKQNKVINDIKSTLTLSDEAGLLHKQNAIADLEESIKKIKDRMARDQSIIDDIKSKDVIVENTSETLYKDTYDMPFVDTKLIDVTGEQASEILNAVGDRMSVADKFFKLKVSSLFEKWMPDFLSTYNILRDEVNTGLSKDLIPAHIYHFSDVWYLPNKKSISYLMKKGGIKKYKDYFEKLQDSFMKSEGGKFVIRSETEYLEAMSNMSILQKDNTKVSFSEVGGASILKDEKFKEALRNYRDEVILNIVDETNRLQKIYGYDIVKAYSKGGSLIKDIIEAKNSDGQFAMRIMGYDRNGFETEISDRMKASGARIKGPHLKTMMDVLFGGDSTFFLSVLGFLKSVHYSLSYGAGSFFLTGNGLVTGFAQVLPNYVELKAYVRNNKEMFREAAISMSKYNFLGGDSVLNQGTGTLVDLKTGAQAQGPIGNLFNKALSSVGKENPRAREAVKFLDMIINNPLGAGDYPLEFTRKLVAVAKTMEAMGFKNGTELDIRMAISGNTFSGTFRSQVSLEFANSGGGVTSASRIYRDTVFAHGNNYLGDSWVFRLPINALGYLMGWSFHKAATSIEKSTAILTGVLQIVSGDAKSGVANIKDGLATWMMYGKNVIYTTGILLKIQKYEEDPNKTLSFDEFQKSFNNSVVSIDILIGRHIDSYKTGQEYKEYLEQDPSILLYNMAGLFDQIIRLYKQPKLVIDIYIRMGVLNSTKDGTQAEHFYQAFREIAVDHWSSYGRFSGLRTAETVYAEQMVSSRLGLLLTGGFTKEEELFNEGFRFKKFKRFAENGFALTIMHSLEKIGIGQSYSLGMRNMIDLKDELLKDENLQNLIHGGKLGVGEGNFDLGKIYGTSKEDLKMFVDLYKDLEKYTFKFENSDGTTPVVGKYGGLNILSADNVFYKERLEKALDKSGFDLEYLMSISNDMPMLIKKLYVLELKYDIKVPLVIAEMVKLDVARIQKRFKKEYGRKNEFGYNVLFDDLYPLSIREALIKNQELLSLNNGFVGSVIDKYVLTKKVDVLEKFETSFDKSDFFTQKNAIEFIQRSQIINDNFMRGSSSVGKLSSRYVNLLGGMTSQSPQMTVHFVNNMLKAIDELPIPKINKLANQAAMLTGLSKTNLGILSNDKEFNKLSESSQALLANWLYKVSDEALDFDSTKYKNAIAEIKTSGRGGGGSSKFKKAYVKTKGSAFGGARPNFSKQFTPMRKFLEGKQGLLKRDPTAFINSQYVSTPSFNTMRFPIVKLYTSLVIKEMFRGFRSSQIVGAGVKTFDKGPKSTRLRTGKKRSLKIKKQFNKKRKGFKFQKGVLSEFPLAK